MREGSRMSSDATQDRSSGPYPSQSTKYWSTVPRRLESSSSRTWYASSAVDHDGRGVWTPAPSSGSPLGPSAGFQQRHMKCQVKSSHLYLYSAFNNTNCDKATAQYQNGENSVNNVKMARLNTQFSVKGISLLNQ